MKKLWIWSIVFSSIMISLASGCKKDETPSGRIPRTTLLKGKWEMVSYMVGSTDMLYEENTGQFQCTSGQYIDYTETYSEKPTYWNFNTNGSWDSDVTYTDQYLDYTTTYNNCEAAYFTDTFTYSDEGTWELSENENQILLNIMGIQDKWNIIEMTSKTMHLELDGGNSHQMYLEKQ